MLHYQRSHVSSFSRPMLKRDFISLLPKIGLDHVAENILSYLDAKSICAAELVSKEWYQVISEGMLWKKLIERRVRTDSIWRGLMEKQNWIKYLFKPSHGGPDPDHMFYRRLYPKIIQVIQNIETYWWRIDWHIPKRMNCESEISKGAYCVQYDDHKIVCGLDNGTIKIWDRNTLECIQVLTGHTEAVACLQFDDTVIISGSWDSTVRFWDVKTGELINTLIHHFSAVSNLRFNNGMMVTCSLDQSIAVWNMVSPSEITLEREISCDRSVFAVEFDEKYILSACGSTIKVWNISTSELVRTLQGHKRAVICLRYRGRHAVSGSEDKTIKLWHVKSGVCLRTLDGHKDFVTCIQFDNKRIVSGAKDGEIKVWDFVSALDYRAPARTLCLSTSVEPSGSISSLQFDDFQILSSSSDDTILIWDFLNGFPPDTSYKNICMTYIKNFCNQNADDIYGIFLVIVFSFVAHEINYG